MQALRDLDLDVPEGAFFVLLGPSGAGKTTTLQRHRLARAGRAEQHEERALGDVEVEIPQRRDVAERLADPGRDDRGLTAGHPTGLGVVDRWRRALVAHGDRLLLGHSRTVGGMRTFSLPASVSTT